MTGTKRGDHRDHVVAATDSDGHGRVRAWDADGDMLMVEVMSAHRLDFQINDGDWVILTGDTLEATLESLLKTIRERC